MAAGDFHFYPDTQNYLLPPGDSNPLPISRKGKTSKDVTATSPQTLAHSLAHEMQIDPDLARVIDAWPRLQEAIRVGILAMIGACKPEA
jgi:hypothetical protein